jgi:hypothetical protein
MTESSGRFELAVACQSGASSRAVSGPCRALRDLAPLLKRTSVSDLANTQALAMTESSPSVR